MAEKVLRKRLDKEVKTAINESDNPYKDDLKASDKMVTTPIKLPKSLENQGIGAVKKKIVVRKPKAYDLFKLSDEGEVPVTPASSYDDVILEND